MKHIGSIIDGDFAYQVYGNDNDEYAIDLGGAVGMTDFEHYDTQEEAFERFKQAVLKY